MNPSFFTFFFINAFNILNFKHPRHFTSENMLHFIFHFLVSKNYFHKTITNSSHQPHFFLINAYKIVSGITATMLDSFVKELMVFCNIFSNDKLGSNFSKGVPHKKSITYYLSLFGHKFWEK